MSLAYLSQYNEAVSSENPGRSVDQEQQGFFAELRKPLQKRNFWCLLKNNILFIDKCFSFLRGTPSPSSGSRNCFQQLHENLARSSLVESCPSTNRVTVVPSPATISRVNFNPTTQKFNLNNFLVFLLCACIPVGSSAPPSTKIMVCLPCPAPVMPANTTGYPSAYSQQNTCGSYPFGVPRKLDYCEPQASRKGRYLPPPAKRHCSNKCLHVCDLKPVKPCKAEKGSPCVAHCFESQPKCAVAISYLMLKFFKIHKDKTSQETNKKVDEESLDENEKETEAVALHTPVLKQKSKKKIRRKEKQAMQFLRPRPNFFLAFQIYDAGIHQKVKKLQEEIIAKNPKLHSALVNISTLHVTLAVTHLADGKDVESFKEKLDEWAEKNETSFFQEPVTLSLTGIKTFRNIVAYLDIEPNKSKEKLLNLSQSMNNLLSSAGFSTDGRDFTPHVTILKLSQNPKLLRFKKSFHDDFEYLKNCKEHFGKQEISNLQLLSMDEPKDEKGYYKCFHQIFVKDLKIEADHSDCCSPTPKRKKPLTKIKKCLQ